MDYLVQAKIGAILNGRLKKTFRSGRWTHGIIGGSPHVASMSYQGMMEDVVFFLGNNGLQRIILMGHSMGDKTTMQGLQYIFLKGSRL